MIFTDKRSISKPSISKTQTRFLRIMIENKVMFFEWKKRIPCKRPVCSSWVFFSDLQLGGRFLRFILKRWSFGTLWVALLGMEQRIDIRKFHQKSESLIPTKRNHLLGGFNMFQCIFYKHTVAGWNGLLRFTPFGNEIKLWTSEHIQARQLDRLPLPNELCDANTSRACPSCSKNDSFGTF